MLCVVSASDQRNTEPPFAVSRMLVPWQAVALLAVIVATGFGFTVTLPVAVEEQPSVLVAVTL
jgi:hypothetical protein